MKKFFFLFTFILLPFMANAAPADVKGYWLSEKEYPLIGHKVTLIITDDTLRHRETKPKKITMEENPDGSIIIKFDEYKKINDSIYNKMYDKIIIIDKNKIIRETPGSAGNRVQRIYNRITEEEALEYIRQQF
ncbi:MAG: hypothetical protein ACLVI5_05690 [Desulfovibrio piger]|jgi:hypothetical protein|uniref:hypothetical protein n=1 Tax=Desulfovibrio piger TaxID=901 RepID=UPI00399B57F2